MRILLINRNHYIDGGADRVYLNTGELLKDNNYEVAYFSTQNEKNLDSDYSSFFVKNINPKSAGIAQKLISVNKYLYNTDASKKLSKLILQFNPDIAHIHLFYGALSASILSTLKKHKIPIVITIHDYRLLCPANAMLDRHGKICEKCKNNRFYNCTIKRCSGGNLFNSSIITVEAYIRQFAIVPLKLINHFIFVSQFSLNKHISFDNRYSHKSSHLYNFTDSPTNESFIKGDYLLYYGRLSREKGLINLINTVKRTNTKLKIAGTGPQKEEIINEIKAFNNIEYVGFKSGEELNELIMNCSFVVVPSEWYENNPMTIVEAFSLGKPAIGSNIGGIPELVSDDTGIIFESGNVFSLSDAIYHAETIGIDDYYRISNNCLKFSRKHFSSKNHLQSLIKLYKSIINDCKESI